jgi:hypothetical protein
MLDVCFEIMLKILARFKVLTKQSDVLLYGIAGFHPPNQTNNKKKDRFIILNLASKSWRGATQSENLPRDKRPHLLRLRDGGNIRHQSGPECPR